MQRLVLAVIVTLFALLILYAVADASWAAPTQDSERQTVPPPKPVEAQDLEPVAWLPLIASSPVYPGASLRTGQVVIDPSIPVVLELWGSDLRSITRWTADMYWSGPLRFRSSQYESGLWAPIWRFDVEPDEDTYHLGLEQWSPYSVSRTEAHLATIGLQALNPTDTTTVYVSTRFDEMDYRIYFYRAICVMPCAFDYDGDGERTIADVFEVDKRKDCAVGDACYELKYDGNGDEVIDDKDVLMATNFWHMPCP